LVNELLPAKQRSRQPTISFGQTSRPCVKPNESDKKSRGPLPRSCGASKRPQARSRSPQISVSQDFRTSCNDTDKGTGKTQAPDLTNARASAGAYFSSWGSWASEKRKGWGNRSTSANQTPVSSPPPSAGPLPGDLKRAEEFQRDKGTSVDGSTLYTPSTSSGHKRVASYNEETDGEQKDNGVFFDAEVAEKEKNAWRTD
jgi:hypothetical protein